jgi:bifunctional non-homologous end joining protein LigD
MANGRVRLDSRAGKTLAESFPEIVAALGETAPGRRLAVDGELVVLGPTGVPDFERLQRRLTAKPSPALRERHPVSYLAFDLVDLDGDSTMDMPYEQRRDLLAGLALTHPRLVVPDHQVDVVPNKLMAIANTFGLEGIVCKRLDSRYRPGRSTAWTKHPIRKRLEVVIGGWIPGQAGGPGALLVGRPVASTRKRVEFVGAVGTGWSVASGRMLQRQLEAIRRDTPPFTRPVPAEYTRGVRWVQPRLIVDVDYRAFTVGGLLRHPSYKGLRPDRDLDSLISDLP